MLLQLSWTIHVERMCDLHSIKHLTFTSYGTRKIYYFCVGMPFYITTTFCMHGRAGRIGGIPPPLHPFCQISQLYPKQGWVGKLCPLRNYSPPPPPRFSDLPPVLHVAVRMSVISNNFARWILRTAPISQYGQTQSQYKWKVGDKYNTTKASKYIPKRPIICINWNPLFRTKIYLVKVPLNVSVVK